jgi:hypothetical protein
MPREPERGRTAVGWHGEVNPGHAPQQTSMKDSLETRAARSGLHWTVLVLAAALAGYVVTGTVFYLSGGGEWLYGESGILEDLSLVCWCVALATALWTAVRFQTPLDRLAAVWMGTLAFLAAARELDLHTWLNPGRLGSMGVRFRANWWLDGMVSPWLKLFWIAAFLVVAAAVLYPPFSLRRALKALLKRGDLGVVLLLCATGFLVSGVLIDDRMRRVRVIPLPIKQLVEETSELIGAACFCASAVVLWRRSANGRWLTRSEQGSAAGIPEAGEPPRHGSAPVRPAIGPGSRRDIQ